MEIPTIPFSKSKNPSLPMKYVDKSLGIIDAIILSLAFYKLICFM